MRWGLFSYHYLGKNLGVALTSLPWLPAKDAAAAFGAPFKINEHGLALWFTTPLYFWLLWPKRFDGQPERKWLYVVSAVSAALPAALDLLYQNTGWRQFGYRFSNDYAVLLFVLLAIGARPMRASSRRRGVGDRVEPVRRGDVRQGAVRPLLLPRRIADHRLPAGLMKAWALCSGIALAACHGAAAAAQVLAPPGTTLETLAVTSRSFPSNGEIPVDYTCDGANRSPQLTWSAPPPGTKSFAVVVDDPDASGGNFTHWIVYNLGADVRALPEGGRPRDGRGRLGPQRLQAAGVRRTVPAAARDPPLRVPRLRPQHAARRGPGAEPRHHGRRHERARPRRRSPGGHVLSLSTYRTTLPPTIASAAASATALRKRDVLAGFDAVPPRPAGVDLEHPARWAADARDSSLSVGRVLDDADEQPVLVDEEQVERDAGVVHPELVVVADAGGRRASRALRRGSCGTSGPAS